MKEYRTCWRIGNTSGCGEWSRLDLYRNVEGLNKKYGCGTHWIEEREIPETTEGKSIPEALRMIAQWIDDGREIEYKKDRWYDKGDSRDFFLSTQIYRAKPRKPLTALHLFGPPRASREVDVIELTPEVRSCLEKEGLL